MTEARFDLQSCHKVFIVDKTAFGHIYFRILRLVIIISPVFHIRIYLSSIEGEETG
jgi:hypothetical protein